MDVQELRNLQEAYLEVYQEQELDEEITPERRAQYKRGLKVRQTNQETVGKGRPRKRATSPQPGAQHYRKGMTQSHRDTMRDAAREENPERPEGSGSLPKGKKLERQRKRGISAESYDIYDIIPSHLLDEGEKPLPYGRMMKKSDELADSDDKKKRNRAAKIYLAANAPKGPKVKVRKEQLDIYDIILSHLLDEGYAETPEAAEAIMVNMSEEWRDSIIG